MLLSVSCFVFRVDVCCVVDACRVVVVVVCVLCSGACCCCAAVACFLLCVSAVCCRSCRELSCDVWLSCGVKELYVLSLCR